MCIRDRGNSELHLDRKLSERRVWPAIDINRSGTRKEDLLFTPEELKRVWMLRKILNEMSPVEAMELLVERMRKSRSNVEFLLSLSPVSYTHLDVYKRQWGDGEVARREAAQVALEVKRRLAERIFANEDVAALRESLLAWLREARARSG